MTRRIEIKTDPLFIGAQLARINAGIDEASLDEPIDPSCEAGICTRQLVHICLFLHSITGNDRLAMTHWMKTNSQKRGSSPVEHMQTASGLYQILYYLESLRS